MTIQERVKKFGEYGISQRTIAELAEINKNTMSSFMKDAPVAERTEDRIKSALKDIALVLYNVAYEDEAAKEEEWED